MGDSTANGKKKKLGLNASDIRMDSSIDALDSQMVRLSNPKDPLSHRQQEADERACVRQDDGLRDAHILIREPVKVTSHDKKDFTDMIKLNIMRWGDCVGRPNPMSRLPI